jgi:hypothetical protein
VNSCRMAAMARRPLPGANPSLRTDPSLRTAPLECARSLAPLALLASLALLATGCSGLQTYPGAKRPRAELARLEPSLQMPGTQILIESVDGVRLGWLNDHALVLPGPHVASVSLVLRGGIGEQRQYRADLRFEAEAGQRYVVLGELYEAGPRLWIADDELRTVAEYDAGLLPSVSAPPAPGETAAPAPAPVH